MTTPKVYTAIAAVIGKLAQTGIAKTRFNNSDQYAYRSVDDVCKAVAPLLAENRLCILPRVLERRPVHVDDGAYCSVVGVVLKVAYDLICARDGSSHTIEFYAEALDDGDKATAKALSSAYKQALLQVFCIPVEGAADPEGVSPTGKTMREPADPDQGWAQWAEDLNEMIRVCQSAEAIDRLRATYSPQLRAMSKRRPELYAQIGEAICNRRKELKPRLSLDAAGDETDSLGVGRLINA